jgi:nucleoredoxin
VHRQKYALPLDSQGTRKADNDAASIYVAGACFAASKSMRRALPWLLYVSLALSSRAAPAPLTANDLGLMLRAGYSNRAVLEELAKRHFADVLDPGKEAMLTRAGANPDVILALKSGTYTLSAQETNAAKEKLAAEAARRAQQAEEARKFDTLYQDQLARERASIRPALSTTNTILSLVKGDLVYWRNGSLSRFDDEQLEKKTLIALYFSAHWCGPCRKFTPQLVDYYNRVAPQHPEFEIIFISLDKSQFAYETYMRETSMPWPAIDYTKLAGKGAIRKYGGDGIPCLVLLDTSGKVISDSFAGKEYLGPAKVLADLDAIFAGRAPANIAASR